MCPFTLLDDCLNHCGREFKHAVRIINFNPKALLLVKISGVFEKALSIHGHESVGDLIKIQRAFTQTYEAMRYHAESLRSISSTQKNSSFLNDPLLKAELKQLRASLTKQQDHFESIRNSLKKSFYSKFDAELTV